MIANAQSLPAKLRTNELWQQILGEYCDYSGTEHTYGHDYKGFMECVQKTNLAVQNEAADVEKDKEEGKDDDIKALEEEVIQLDAMAAVDDILQEYGENVDWWRENLRVGATYPLEEEDTTQGIPTMLSNKWKWHCKDGNVDSKKIKTFKALANGCHSAPHVKLARDALIKKRGRFCILST